MATFVIWSLRFVILILCLQGAETAGIPTNGTKTYIVGSVLVEPFLMRREEGHLAGQADEYEGFIPDLLHELSQSLGVNFKIQLIEGGKMGFRLRDGTWDGVVGALTRHEIDLGAGPLTITAKRHRVIDFSKPIMATGMVMVIAGSLPQDVADAASASRVGLVLRPFTPLAWFMLLAAFFVIFLFAVIVVRVSPAEEKQNLLRSLSSLLTTSSESGRYSVCVLRTTFTIFVVLSVVLYTAGVVSLLIYTARTDTARTVPPPDNTKVNIADLIHSHDYKMVVVRDGSSHTFFRHTTVPLYYELYERLTYVDNLTAGFDLLLKDPSYAFITDKPLVDAYTSRPPYCSLSIVGNQLNSNGYGLGYHLDSPLKDVTDLSILELRENGIMQSLHRKWWTERTQCNRPTLPSVPSRKVDGVPARPGIDAHTLGGALIVLAVGLLLAVVAALMERACHFRSSKVNVGSRTLRELDGEPLHNEGS